MADTRSLHRKLAQVMYEAERIPKRGKAPQVMGGYEFVQVGDAADFIRKALSEKVLTMMPTKIEVVGQVDRPTKAGGSMTTLDLRVEWTISDGESGETITIESFGAGADGGDKYSGKAMTNAMKYALLAGFLLSTGDDVELGTHEAARTSEPIGKAPPHTAKPDPVREATRADEPELIGPYTAAGQLGVNPKPPADGFMRQEPDGALVVVTFTDVENHKVPQVMVRGGFAADLVDAAGNDLNGLVCEVTGDLYRVPWFKENRAMPPFQRLELKSIRTNAWTLPVPGQTGPGLFDDSDEAELDALV